MLGILLFSVNQIQVVPSKLRKICRPTGSKAHLPRSKLPRASHQYAQRSTGRNRCRVDFPHRAQALWQPFRDIYFPDTTEVATLLI